MENNVLAPIVVFAYNRADRLRKLIESLAVNPEASECVLYIFSDGPKNPESENKVNEVREYLNTLSESSFFKKVNVIKFPINKGLASSIISGVTQVMNQYGRAIIVEDDNIVAPDFLDYMNRGLAFYRDDASVWAISGFSRFMKYPKDYNHDVFVMQRISSYTWASWKDRWDRTEWEIKDYPQFLWDRSARKKFDEWGKDRSLMLDAQVTGKINSWAIRFEYSMVKNNMYSIAPCVSRAVCSGNDGSGTHSKKETHTYDTVLSDGSQKVNFEHIEMDERIRKEFVRPYQPSIIRRIIGNWDKRIDYYMLKGIRNEHK